MQPDTSTSDAHRHGASTKSGVSRTARRWLIGLVAALAMASWVGDAVAQPANDRAPSEGAPDATTVAPASNAPGDGSLEPVAPANAAVEAPKANDAASSSQARNDEPPEYFPLIRSALEEYEKTNYAEARALFLRAHELFPNARTLRGLGMVEFEMRNYGAAVHYLEASLASPTRRLDDTLQREVQALLDRARRFVDAVDLRLVPSTAEVVVDGIDIELTRGQPLVLEVGEHVLEFRATGHAPERRVLRVRGGERQKLYVVLRPEGEAMAQDAPHQPSRAWWKSPWLWAGVGAALAGTAAALVVTVGNDDSTPEPREPTTTTGVVLW